MTFHLLIFIVIFFLTNGKKKNYLWYVQMLIFFLLKKGIFYYIVCYLYPNNTSKSYFSNWNLFIFKYIYWCPDLTSNQFDQTHSVRAQTSVFSNSFQMNLMCSEGWEPVGKDNGASNMRWEWAFPMRFKLSNITVCSVKECSQQWEQSSCREWFLNSHHHPTHTPCLFFELKSGNDSEIFSVVFLP